MAAMKQIAIEIETTPVLSFLWHEIEQLKEQVNRFQQEHLELHNPVLAINSLKLQVEALKEELTHVKNKANITTHDQY
jgi:prefoldin subunit 5